MVHFWNIWVQMTPKNLGTHTSQHPPSGVSCDNRQRTTDNTPLRPLNPPNWTPSAWSPTLPAATTAQLIQRVFCLQRMGVCTPPLTSPPTPGQVPVLCGASACEDAAIPVLTDRQGRRTFVGSSSKQASNFQPPPISQRGLSNQVQAQGCMQHSAATLRLRSTWCHGRAGAAGALAQRAVCHTS